jgi:hypothetical protein
MIAAQAVVAEVVWLRMIMVLKVGTGAGSNVLRLDPLARILRTLIKLPI